MDDFYKYFPLCIFGLQIIMGWLLWSLKREFVSKNHCDACQKSTGNDINQLNSRTQSVEDKLHNMPSVKNIHDLSLQISTMAGAIRSLSEILERVEQKVMRQEDYLMHQGGK